MLRPFLSYKRKRFYFLLTLLLSMGLAAVAVDFRIEGDYEGLYLLRGSHGKALKITDHIFLGEYERLLAKVEFDPLLAPFRSDTQRVSAGPYLTYKWQEKTGHGYIQNYSPDGTKMVICFGRFIDSQQRVPQGLFVGGGLPYSSYDKSTVRMNETGMAFFNGKKWFHIWCNANEGIAGASAPAKMLYPSTWQFLGSKVLFAHDDAIILKSSHRVTVDGAPMQIDRFVFYKAGDTFFLLVNRITNLGQAAAGYYYVYGDEPWLGDYGTSAGNVGWVQDRLYQYEGLVDPLKYSWFGLYDCGNKAVSEKEGAYSGLANFIEWLGDLHPNLVYFSNKEGAVAPESARVPLGSANNRVMFLQWGPRLLQPGASDLQIMAIGMAGVDPRSKMPVKPKVTLTAEDLNFAIGNQH